MRRAALALATLCALGPASARADTPPSAWDRVREPAVADTYRLHVEVQRRMAAIDPRDLGKIGRGDVADAILGGTISMLERAGARTSKDVRLRFDLGWLYLEARMHAKAIEVLDAALRDAPEHPAAERAWLNLAFACGHLGDHACERRAYLEVLRHATEEPARLTPTLNLAETEMHLGNLREAVEGYREAMRLASRLPSRDSPALAAWGLAVALDRSGDRVGAEREARFALQLEQSAGYRPRGGLSVLRSQGVFFFPDYEVYWYEGLGALAQARAAKSAAEAVALLRDAERAYGRFVQGAERSREPDRWLAIARARLAAVKVEREAAEKRRGREPRREVDDADDVPL